MRTRYIHNLDTFFSYIWKDRSEYYVCGGFLYGCAWSDARIYAFIAIFSKGNDKNQAE